MKTFSKNQIIKLIEKGQRDTICSVLAASAARNQLNFEANEFRISSLSSMMLSPLEAEAIDIEVFELPTLSQNQIVCRFEITQVQSMSKAKVLVAEGHLVFEVIQSALCPEVQETKQTKSRPKTETAMDRKFQILDGALKVISKKGFGNASMREIAEEAGLSVPLMYKYIKDKDDILYQITSSSMANLFDHFGKVTSKNAKASQKLTDAIAHYIEYINHNRRYINLVYSETRSLSPEYRQKVFETERALIGKWQDILDEGVASGVFRPVNTELMANFVYFLCTAWSLRYWSIGHYDSADVEQQIQSLVLDGIAR